MLSLGLCDCGCRGVSRFGKVYYNACDSCDKQERTRYQKEQRQRADEGLLLVFRHLPTHETGQAENDPRPRYRCHDLQHDLHLEFKDRGHRCEQDQQDREPLLRPVPLCRFSLEVAQAHEQAVQGDPERVDVKREAGEYRDEHTHTRRHNCPPVARGEVHDVLAVFHILSEAQISKCADNVVQGDADKKS